MSPQHQYRQLTNAKYAPQIDERGLVNAIQLTLRATEGGRATGAAVARRGDGDGPSLLLLKSLGEKNKSISE